MNVLDIHERALPVDAARIGALIDTLASERDLLWPRSWPPMRFDRPLGVGAVGGHGPIRYVVEAYAPGRSVRFRFTGPEGFDGWHGLEVVTQSGRAPVLRHTLEMRARGKAALSWPLIFRPLHDALVEDALATAEASLGLEQHITPWAPRVKLLRWMITGGKAGPQSTAALHRGHMEPAR